MPGRDIEGRRNVRSEKRIHVDGNLARDADVDVGNYTPDAVR